MPLKPSTSSTNAADFYVQQDDVFGRIANRYDLLCDLFSLGIHRLWKQRVASIIARESRRQIIDCATGTGDIILRVLKHQEYRSGRGVLASDISPQMLVIAKRRISRISSSVEYRVLDAHAMPEIPTASRDLYSISLGLKICERERVLKEAFRVLRPGGGLVILEASNIPWAWLHNLYLLYMRLCMPVIGWLATGGDTSAYTYLLKGIENFATAEQLAQELEAIGFEEVSFERLSLGIVAIHVARKPFTALS